MNEAETRAEYVDPNGNVKEICSIFFSFQKVEEAVKKSGVQEGIVLVNSMHSR